MKRRRRQIVGTAVLVTTLLTVSVALPLLSRAAVDTSVKHWWQFDPIMWGHGFSAHPRLVKTHQRFHDNHPHPTEAQHDKFHKQLARDHRQLHFHKAIESETGDATWYDADGATGACGERLHGMYVAHRTWPCGSLVSVRSGGDYVFVHVMDRGPYGDGRIVDLSKKAFRKLAPPSKGVIDDVHAVRLKKK